MKLLVKNLKKLDFWQIMTIFWHFLAKKNPVWIFRQVPLLTHASRYLGEDFRKFSAKTNDKNWSYKSKTFKKLDFWQKWPFFDNFWPKNPQFWIFPWVQLLAHARRHIGEHLRKFSAKTNDKNWSYKSKTLKKLDFWQKWPFFVTFWPKKSPILNFPTGTTTHTR